MDEERESVKWTFTAKNIPRDDCGAQTRGLLKKRLPQDPMPKKSDLNESGTGTPLPSRRLATPDPYPSTQRGDSEWPR